MKTIYKHLKMETMFMNTENSRINKSDKFHYYFIDKLSIKDPNKNIALVNLSIYYTRKTIKSAHDNSKFKISVPTWNDEFDLYDRSHFVSDIQDYFEYIIKRHETVEKIHP